MDDAKVPPATAHAGPVPDADGLILLAHGARDPGWAAPFERVAAAVRTARPAARVTLAFLEFMAPDLPTAGARLAAAGCRCVTVLPLFLGVGGHVRKDLPALLEGLRARHPGVSWTLAPAIGEDERLITAMAAIAADTLTDIRTTHVDSPAAPSHGTRQPPATTQATSASRSMASNGAGGGRSV